LIGFSQARSWLSGEVAATFKKEPAVKREPLMDNFSSEPLLDFVHKVGRSSTIFFPRGMMEISSRFISAPQLQKPIRHRFHY